MSWLTWILGIDYIYSFYETEEYREPKPETKIYPKSDTRGRPMYMDELHNRIKKRRKSIH